MKYFTVEQVIPGIDSNFLNSTDFEFRIESKNPIHGGWHDMYTSRRILSESDKIVFTVHSQEDELVLRLRFGDRKGNSIYGEYW